MSAIVTGGANPSEPLTLHYLGLTGFAGVSSAIFGRFRVRAWLVRRRTSIGVIFYHVKGHNGEPEGTVRQSQK